MPVNCNKDWAKNGFKTWLIKFKIDVVIENAGYDYKCVCNV